MKISKNFRNKLKMRVYAGATFLDAKRGAGWEKEITKEELALNDGTACILGQLYGEYVEGLAELAVPVEARELQESLGFFLRGEGSSPTPRYRALTSAWKQLLRSRRA